MSCPKNYTEYKMIDKETKFSAIKDNDDIASALQEIMKVKNINIDINDNDSMEEIAKKIGVDINDLLLIANKKNGTIAEFYQKYPETSLQAKDSEPDWMSVNDMVDLDVRPSLAKGVDPFGLIMQTVAQLNGKILHIINSFEPAPLYSVLGKQGFEHYSKQENGIWHIYFYKK